MITIQLYNSERYDEWENFLINSKNGSFLFSRNFLEYHKDRFHDFSLMVYNDDELVALMPADRKDNETIVSHSGLTYGGFILSKNVYTKDSLIYFSEMLKFCSLRDIKILLFKQIPSFYSKISSDEVDYALFLAEAELFRVDIASNIALEKYRIPYQERRNRAINKAKKLGAYIKEKTYFAEFWNVILSPNLLERFGVAPVHSLAEMEYLAKMNPGKIRQFNAYIGDGIMAGTTIFENDTTAHAQYISASVAGRQNGSIDLLFHHLISATFSHKSYFDFGIVNEEEGKKVNVGLLDWKEGFGARSYAHRFYKVFTKNHSLINSVVFK